MWKWLLAKEEESSFEQLKQLESLGQGAGGEEEGSCGVEGGPEVLGMGFPSSPWLRVSILAQSYQRVTAVG